MLICSSCNFANRGTGAFCLGCGATLAAKPSAPAPTQSSADNRCPACHVANPAIARFCKDCGHTLGGSSSPAPAPLPAGAQVHGLTARTGWKQGPALSSQEMHRAEREAEETGVAPEIIHPTTPSASSETALDAITDEFGDEAEREAAYLQRLSDKKAKDRYEKARRDKLAEYERKTGKTGFELHGDKKEQAQAQAQSPARPPPQPVSHSPTPRPQATSPSPARSYAAPSQTAQSLYGGSTSQTTQAQARPNSSSSPSREPTRDAAADEYEARMKREREEAKQSYDRSLWDDHVPSASSAPDATCPGCQRGVSEFDRRMQAEGQTWHVDCWKCAHCQKPIGLGKYFTHDGRGYCSSECVRSVRAAAGEFETCGSCHRPIDAGGIMKALGKSWHDACFKCAKCGTSFPDGRFYNVNSQPYCGNCAN